MKPDTTNPDEVPSRQSSTGHPQLSQQPSSHTAEDRLAQQNAAAHVLRQKIDSLYGDQSVAVPQEATAPTQQSIDTQSPYHRTHSAHPLPEEEQWKVYHSAWQNYYQQYYQQYYTHQAKQQKAAEPSSVFTKTIEPAAASTPDETVTKDEALYELRQKLLGKVQASAQKIRKSRHFMPIIASLAVVLIFVFVQYNRVFISNVQAYVSPGSVDPQNIVIDPGADVQVGPDPRLIIPKINVDAPALYDVGTDHTSQMSAMEKGVAHFPIPGANSHPGEIGNTVLSGHSSNDLFDPGEYKFIFAQLDKLQPGDTIYANYQGKRYTYVVTKKEVVRPNEVSKLVYETNKPMMTLITCTPLGTALNRLLVTAEQVSPDPASAAAAPSAGSQGSNSAAMPGNSPTMVERLFGAR